MAVIHLVSERPLCRARAARRLIDWYTQAASECALALYVLPEEGWRTAKNSPPASQNNPITPT